MMLKCNISVQNGHHSSLVGSMRQCTSTIRACFVPGRVTPRLGVLPICHALAESMEGGLLLNAPDGGADIAIFGAVHGDPDGMEIAEYILRRKPVAVVVETALNAAHGSATGNIAELNDCLGAFSSNGTAQDGRTRALAHIGLQLTAVSDPLSSSLWSDLARTSSICSEERAYAAAFAVRARIVHGDRPKGITYHRMLLKPSLQDLDATFGLHSAINYCDLVPAMRHLNAKNRSSTGVTEGIFMEERDAVLVQSLYNASIEAGSNELVVGVVGASHLAGIQRLWTDGSWRQIIAAGVMEVPNRVDEEPPEVSGVRRALFDSVIRLTCRGDVMRDIEITLGDVPGEASEVYDLSRELYGSSRMLLAVLDEDQLHEVCHGWRYNMWEILMPLREVRPVNGGPGYDKELVMQLRTLNYEIV